MQKKKKTNETTVTSSVGPHLITLSKSRKWDKELLSVKRKVSKRKKSKERREGGKAPWPIWTAWPFSCPHQEGRERKQTGSPLLQASTLDEKVLPSCDSKYPSSIFFLIEPLIHPNTCSGKRSNMTQSARSLANWWAMSKENISKNIMMLAGKIGFHLHRNSQEYLFGEMFL